jgi:hypothetical protein
MLQTIDRYIFKMLFSGFFNLPVMRLIQQKYFFILYRHERDEKRIQNFNLKLERKGLLRRPRHRWKDISSISTDLNDIGWEGVHWFRLV